MIFAKKEKEKELKCCTKAFKYQKAGKMKNTMDAGWFYSRGQIFHYFCTRFSSLVPPKAKVRNPINILRELSKQQWLFFVCGFLARAWDAFDYYCVSMTLTELDTAFDTNNKSISWVRRLLNNLIASID